MRWLLAVALLSSLSARAGVSSKAGATKVVDAGANPRRVLRLAAPRGAEKLTVRANIEQGPSKIAIEVELRATPKGGVWSLSATRLSLDTGHPLPAKAQADFDAACARAAKELGGAMKVSPRGRISDVIWTLSDATKEQSEVELRRAIVHFLNAVGEIVPLLGEVLPETAVGAGASWDSAAEVRKEMGGEGVTMTGRAHYEAVAVDPSAKLRVTTRLAVAPVQVAGKKLSLTGDLTGTLQIDDSRALPAAMKLESLMTFEVEGEHASMHVDMDLVLGR